MKFVKTLALVIVFSVLCTVFCEALYKSSQITEPPNEGETPKTEISIKNYSAFASGSPILNDITVSAGSALLCSSDGLLIYEKNADLPLPMASITKVMTVICALETVSDINETVTVPDKAVGIEGSSVYLAKGERVTYEMLLYSAMLESANDATTALAVLCGGSEEAFVLKMNEKARTLSMNSTHFCNPHGLHENEHYTTARDYVRLMSYALENEAFCKLISTKKITFAKLDNSMTRVLSNHNRLLNTYNGMLGGKTGFTKASGRTLITAAKRNGTTLICITLDAPDDWNDHKKLFDAGFEAVNTVVFDGISEEIQIGAGESDTLTLKQGKAKSFCIKNGESITYKTTLPYNVLAPITIGEEIGKIDFYKNGVKIDEAPLVAEHSVGIKREENKKGIFYQLLDFLKIGGD